MMIFMAVFTTLMTGPLLRVVYSDRRLARDIAEAERAALGLPNAYRVIVATPDAAYDAPVSVGRDVLARETPAELVLAQIRPLAAPVLEVGSGLSFELADFAESAGRLEAVRRRVEDSGAPSVTLVRMSDDPAAELAGMANELEGDVVVVNGSDGMHAAVADRVSCQVVSVTSGVFVPDADVRSVGVVLEGGRDADAAVEIAVRLALARGAEVGVVDAASPGEPSRRANGLIEALTKAGLVAKASTGTGVDVVVLAVGSAATVNAPVSVRVSAEQDRDVLSPDRLVSAVVAKAAAPVPG